MKGRVSTSFCFCILWEVIVTMITWDRMKMNCFVYALWILLTMLRHDAQILT